jgi:hypothetical protein
MGFVIGMLMVVLGLAGIVIAVTGTQGQVWATVTGHTSTGTLLSSTTTTASISNAGPAAGGTQLL